MKILLVGSGGREHALAWKILSSPRLTKLFVTSTNASPFLLQQQYGDKIAPPVKIAEDNIHELTQFAVQEKIDSVIIGGETPLAAGLSDALIKAGIPAFGPTQAAAQIEASKAFAKDFMTRHQIPTARYQTFTNLSNALHHVRTIDYPVVIKASGLAAGKGVFLPETLTETESILQELLQQHTLGAAGNEIVIEERLQGEEVSLLAFTDGYTVKVMPPARDHKRLLDNNQGPNTGGMGAYAPATTICPPVLQTELTKTILEPAINGLRAEGKLFVGVLYAGLMLTTHGPRVIEFNCRFGDPETQVLLPLLDSDLLTIVKACTEGNLADCAVNWKNTHAVCVILASQDYPQKSATGFSINGLTTCDAENVTVFQAGTRLDNQQIVTAGGRVLGVTVWDNNLADAIKIAYQHIGKIHFTGMQYRQDIGTHMTTKEIDHYAAAGVNIDEGAHTVELMSAAVRNTYGPEVLAGIGAFGGMFDASALKNMAHPVLVASTDGIGTKVHLAAQFNRLHTLGYDIVNHSVNDILVQGAKPLFFLDYLATSQLDAEKMASIVIGMADACRAVNCALLGGETAEMPGIYMPNTFDVAGTIVGVVERSQALPQNNLQAGDVLLGLASSGPHTNGYSLIRKVLADVDLTTLNPALGMSLIDALLAPHRCYLPILQAAMAHPKAPIKALIHITGGGFIENIPRVLPKNLNADIQLNSWTVPPLFAFIQQHGNIPLQQMYRVLNMGIGMMIVTAPEHVNLLRELISEQLWQIGALTPGEQRVNLQ